jgi:hypothetical protein
MLIMQRFCNLVQSVRLIYRYLRNVDLEFFLAKFSGSWSFQNTPKRTPSKKTAAHPWSCGTSYTSTRPCNMMRAWSSALASHDTGPAIIDTRIARGRTVHQKLLERNKMVWGDYNPPTRLQIRDKMKWTDICYVSTLMARRDLHTKCKWNSSHINTLRMRTQMVPERWFFRLLTTWHGW